MSIENVFNTGNKFDLENGISLKKFVGHEFLLNDFDTGVSQNWNSPYAIIETSDGEITFTWSTVIVQKLEQLQKWNEEEWKYITLKVVETESKSGHMYMDLQFIKGNGK